MVDMTDGIMMKAEFCWNFPAHPEECGDIWLRHIQADFHALPRGQVHDLQFIESLHYQAPIIFYAVFFQQHHVFPKPCAVQGSLTAIGWQNGIRKFQLSITLLTASKVTGSIKWASPYQGQYMVVDWSSPEWPGLPSSNATRAFTSLCARIVKLAGLPITIDHAPRSECFEYQYVSPGVFLPVACSSRSISDRIEVNASLEGPGLGFRMSWKLNAGFGFMMNTCQRNLEQWTMVFHVSAR